MHTMDEHCKRHTPDGWRTWLPALAAAAPAGAEARSTPAAAATARARSRAPSASAATQLTTADTHAPSSVMGPSSSAVTTCTPRSSLSGAILYRLFARLQAFIKVNKGLYQVAQALTPCQWAGSSLAAQPLAALLHTDQLMASYYMMQICRFTSASNVVTATFQLSHPSEAYNHA